MKETEIRGARRTPQDPSSRQDEVFERLMDEIDVVAAVLEDVDESMHSRLTMWIDYMIYRALYQSGEAEECANEARECRRLLADYFADLAWDG